MSDELFSYRLRRYRERHGLSMDALGKALGVTGRYIGMIERGDKDVEPSSSIYKLFALIEAEKVPLREVEKEEALLQEPMAEYRVEARAKPGLTINDCISQIRADLDLVQRGSAEERRRAFVFLQDIHMPLLGSLLQQGK